MTGSPQTSPFKDDIEQLSDRARLVFMAMICERLLPNFARFEADEGTGLAAPLRAAIDLTWKVVNAGHQEPADQEEAGRLLHECVPLMPHSEDTTSEWTSAAIDAFSAACTTLEAVNDRPTSDKTLTVATCATDSVDVHIQLNELDDRTCIGPREEQFIANHPLMQRELGYLSDDLRELKALGQTLNAEAIARLRSVATSRGGSLDPPSVR